MLAYNTGQRDRIREIPDHTKYLAEQPDSTLGAVAAAVMGVGAHAAAAPADSVVEFWVDGERQLDCGSDIIDVCDEGWVTYARDIPGERNDRIRNFHITRTYVNAGGDTWIYRGVGHIHFFFVEGAYHGSVQGHTTDVPPFPDDPESVAGDGSYGRWVLNHDTGAYSVVGSYQGVLDDEACAALGD
jgi:hypothetical protein